MPFADLLDSVKMVKPTLDKVAEVSNIPPIAEPTFEDVVRAAEPVVDVSGVGVDDKDIGDEPSHYLDSSLPDNKETKPKCDE